MHKSHNMEKEIKLSIVIVSFNSTKELPACLDSLYKFNCGEIKSGKWEIINVDNFSSDDTVAWLNREGKNYPGLTVIINKDNLGFGAANNRGALYAKGKYVLFLNPDTVVEKNTINIPLDYLSSHPDVGAVSAKTVLGNGQIDSSCHRGFPTPWNTFCYFSGLTRMFPKSKYFAGYTLGHLDLNTTHEVDAINGAFFLMPRDVGGQLNWFDEDFFWKGEDLDLCFRLKKAGYKIIYLPNVQVIHHKGSSKGHARGSKSLSARFEVMKLFYEKHYHHKYPAFVYYLVMVGIKARKIIANLGV